jgi:hypothetical protein
MRVSIRRLLGISENVRLPSIESRDAYGFFGALDQFQQDAFAGCGSDTSSQA